MLPAAPAELADREREVLDLMAAGLSNPAIAARLYLSEKTVRNYVTNIVVKLGVPDRSSAIVKGAGSWARAAALEIELRVRSLPSVAMRVPRTPYALRVVAAVRRRSC